MSGRCQKYLSSTVSVDQLMDFTLALYRNRVTVAKKQFQAFPVVVQCIFLAEAWNVLSHQTKHSVYSLRMTFHLFKLFRSREMKNMPSYHVYGKRKTTDKLYKRLKNRMDKLPRPGRSKERAKATSKYEKKYQRRPTPEADDPLLIFYSSAYEDQPTSRLAIQWLTHHGVYDGIDRTKLERQYEAL